MLTSLALIFLVGMALGWVFSRLRLPSLLGMLLTGILLGPYVLNLLDDSILGISADLRQLALIIILTRAGLSLQVDDLKRVGRPAVLMCFVPACFEVAGMLLLAPPLLGISLLEYFRRTARKELEASRHFTPQAKISNLAAMAQDFVSLGNQTGEGWFLTGEMLELIHSGVENIVCTQPFGCLPNHIVGKGVIKELRRQYPGANIIAVDYDPGASEVNQLNRIKLMLATAHKNLKKKNG